MSSEAKALIHYSNHSQHISTSPDDAEYCAACARKWAVVILAGNY